MPTFGLNAAIDLDDSICSLPGNVFINIRDKLDSNPADKDWRALVRKIDQKFDIKPYLVERWSPAISGESGAAKLLNELSSQGMTVLQLRDALESMEIDTHTFGLMPYTDIVIKKAPPTDVELYEGDILVLDVEATGHPYPRYQWFFCPDGKNDFQRLQGYTEPTLSIKDITQQNAGAYACQIHNCRDPDKTKLTGHVLVTVKTKQNPAANTDNNLVIFHHLQDPIEREFAEGVCISKGYDEYSFNSRMSSIVFNLIVSHPRDITVGIGDPIELSVGTKGDPPITYQWYKDNVLLKGQTMPRLYILHAMPDDLGRYYCIVDNMVKRETSVAAVVKERNSLPAKKPEIVIIAQPKSLTVSFAASALFICEANCSDPLQYQWFKDGTPLEGETTCELKFTNIQERIKEGLYVCKISLAKPVMLPDGSMTQVEKLSAGAMLTVKVPSVNDNTQFNPSDKVALLIGNSDYKSENPLKAPSQDVQNLTESLNALNFKVVSLLNLTKPEIENAVLEFCNLVDRNVYALFYFCGHGFEENGMSFLVPTDAPSAYKAEECVCADMVLEHIQRKQPPLIFMIMDICRQAGKVPSPGVTANFEKKTKRGNTVFCYATSSGMAAYENNTHGYGLLVNHLSPLIQKKIGVDQLVSELKEEFARVPKHSNIQIPELKSNLLEPRRSLTDHISYKGETELFNRRTQRWNESRRKPDQQIIDFPEIGAAVELSFESNFSNILCVYVSVVRSGQALNCIGRITNFSPRISQLGEMQTCTRGGYLTTMTVLQDIQKLEANLKVEVTITFHIRGYNGDYFLMRRLDLGQPLVAKLNLFKPAVGFQQQRREPIEQTEETDSSLSLDMSK